MASEAETVGLFSISKVCVCVCMCLCITQSYILPSNVCKAESLFVQILILTRFGVTDVSSCTSVGVKVENVPPASRGGGGARG